MFPPVWAIPRTARHRHVIGGMQVEPGADVLVAVYAMHRSVGAWHEPLTFDSTRFDAGGSHQRNDAYLPFGSGPRRCLGSEFALSEVTFVLAAMLARYRLESAAELQPRERATLTLSPLGAIPMRVSPRE